MAKTLGFFFKNHVPSTKIQPHPPLSVTHKPHDADDKPMGNPGDGDPHDHPGQQRTPILSQPARLPAQPAPILSKPKDVAFQPPPTLSVPSDVPFTPAPPLSTPVEIPFQEAPPLSTPAALEFQEAPPLNLPHPPTSDNPDVYGNPNDGDSHDHPGQQPIPELSSPMMPKPTVQVMLPVPYSGTVAHAGDQPTPDMLKPRPVDMSTDGANEFFDLSGYADEWKSAVERQKQFFAHDIPRIAANMINRALPRPGNIDPDVLPSTIATKALSAVANKIHSTENKYVYEPIANVGASVSRAITSVVVNSAPEGAYENSSQAASIKKINDAGRDNKKLSLSDVFVDKKFLNSAFANEPKADRASVRMNQDSKNSSFWFDDQRGQLSDDHDIGVAAGSSYFPFYVTDLRPTSDGKYRTVFFKPFDLQVGESFAPTWNLQNFIGRVDPVATYQNTTRTLNVSFKMIAQHPSDLPIIYKKLNWLSSMVYPEYGANMRYRSGPVVRMRIGDLVNARSSLIPDTKDRPGATGILTSLDYSYVPIWEIESDWQLSRDVDVSFTFVVLHELPIGILNGEFGTVGVIDTDGVYTTPQQALERKIAGANDEAPTNEKDYVDVGGFRKFGGKK